MEAWVRSEDSAPPTAVPACWHRRPVASQASTWQARSHSATPYPAQAGRMPTDVISCPQNFLPHTQRPCLQHSSSRAWSCSATSCLSLLPSQPGSGQLRHAGTACNGTPRVGPGIGPTPLPLQIGGEDKGAALLPPPSLAAPQRAGPRPPAGCQHWRRAPWQHLSPPAPSVMVPSSYSPNHLRSSSRPRNRRWRPARTRARGPSRPQQACRGV